MTGTWPSVLSGLPERGLRTLRPSFLIAMLNATSSSAVMNKSTSKQDSMREFIQLHRTTVPYVNQSYTWDCGLACAEMALRAKGVKVSVWDLRNQCTTDSVWSIDIAYLLHRYNLTTSFFTITKGVRPEYRKQEFYKKQLMEDTKRVNHLFANAEQNGVHVMQKQVSCDDIRNAIHKENKLVLVLIDKQLLRCSLCERSTTCSKSLHSTRSSSGFLGHYILVYAYHPGTDKFLMKDPAAARETCVISATVLEQSRMAFGTDQDILFIGEVDQESSASSIQTELDT